MKGFITAILIGMGAGVTLAQPVNAAQTNANADVGALLEEWFGSEASDAVELSALLEELLALAESLD